MNWHVVSVNSRTELDVTAKINGAGFVAHCPTYVKKIQRGRWSRQFIQTRVEVLFACYIFVGENSDFRPGDFESSKTRLTVLRKGLITDEAMAMINSTANDLTMQQSKMTHSLVIKRGDLMQILHGAMQGEPVEVLQAKKDQLLVRWKDKPGWRDAWVSRAALGKAI